MKRLRADAAAACPGLSEAALDELVPLKASVQMQKLANRAVVYSVADGEPLFFEVRCWWARWWVYLAWFGRAASYDDQDAAFHRVLCGRWPHTLACWSHAPISCAGARSGVPNSIHTVALPQCSALHLDLLGGQPQGVRATTWLSADDASRH